MKKTLDAWFAIGDAMKVPVYLDHHSTTPVDERVANKIKHAMLVNFGNPSSVDHVFGDQAAELVEQALEEVRRLVSAEHDTRVVITSGATEALNLAILGLTQVLGEQLRRPVKIGVSTIEHAAVHEPVARLGASGAADVVPIRVDAKGTLDLQHLEDECRKGLELVCVMAANNEVGTIQPTAAAAQIVKKHGGLLLVDASQAAGRIPVSFEDWDIDLLALTAHKMYGPKGVGVLVVRPNLHLRPLLYGGAQQERLRPGTLNVPGIAGLGEAARLRRQEQVADEQRIARLRDSLERGLCSVLPEARVNGDRTNRLAGNCNMSFPIPAHAIIARVRDKIAISTGSACSSGIEQPSHVLQAMGLQDWRSNGAIRFGLGRLTTEDEIDFAIDLISSAAKDAMTLVARH